MECRPTQSVVTDDYNYDDQPDRLTVTSYPDDDSCGENSGLTKYVLDLGKGARQFVQAFSIRSHGDRGGGWVLATSESVWARHFEASGKTFHVNDLVAYRSDRVRIDGIDFYIDENGRRGGWRAHIREWSSPLNSGWLRLVAPARRLDVATYRLMGDVYREQAGNLARRRLLLSGGWDSLTPEDRARVVAVERQIAMSAQRHVKRLRLDPGGEEILVRRLGQALDFHEPYETLVAKPGTLPRGGGGPGAGIAL